MVVLSVPETYATIQLAINAASNGDTIQLGSGTYSGNFDISKTITLIGPNVGITGNSQERTAEAILLNTKSNILTNCIIDGIKFRHTDNITDALIIQSGPTIQNCIFERVATVAGQTARAISSSTSASNYNIKNNLFTGSIEGGLFSGHKTWNSGLFFTNNGNIGNIEGNTFSNCRTAVNADNNNSLVTLNNNIFFNCGTYISFGGTTPPTSGMVITNNIFNITNLGSALVNNSNVVDSFKLNISENNFQFDNNIITSQELSLEQKFLIESKLYHKGRSSRKGIVYFRNNEQFVVSGLSSITTALTFAPISGETIFINTGTYIENIIVNKQLTIQGVDKSSTIIKSVSNALVPTVQLTDGSSNTTITDLTIQCRVTTLSTTGSGNANNNDSGILFLNTNTTTNPYISNITLNNLVIQNSSNGICFNNKNSSNITISNCIIQNNEGSGIRIATNTEVMNGFTVNSSTIQNNNLNAISSNPSGSYRPNCTNYSLNNCTISNNNKLTANNSHDVSIFGFNGNISILNTTITSNHYESKQINGSSATSGGWGFIIYGSNSSNIIRDSGNILLSNLTFNGNVIKSGFGIDRYNNLGDISFNNVDFRNYISNKANQTWSQLSIGHMDLTKNLNLGNTKLLNILASNIGSIDASNCSFYRVNGTLLSNNDNADLLEITNLVYDNTDNNLLGSIIIGGNLTIVSPITANSIVNAINNISNNEETSTNTVNEIKLISGNYTITSNLENTSTKPILLKVISGRVKLVRS